MRLQSLLETAPYEGYGYSYPHKVAYGPLSPRVPLESVWHSEDKGALFLYVHVPFCETRCGFCNLLALARGREDLVAGYLEALGRQIRTISRLLPDARFARLALGGGTPTYLSTAQLECLLDRLERLLLKGPVQVPASCETSPSTATRERVRLLAQRGISRVSLGVQSFEEAETRTLGRAHRNGDAQRALAIIRSEASGVLNIDLIYGIPGQTRASLGRSLRQALTWQPEEIYLYPLYVRRLTGLWRAGVRPGDGPRRELYRFARDLLLSEGYVQASMRLFRLDGVEPEPGPAYSCQEDGMVGLGPGARSYTTALHYSSEWAVLRSGVRSIIQDYAARDGDDFAYAHHGFWLTPEERRRRHVIKSLLFEDGLVEASYRSRFGASPEADFPELGALVEEGLATRESDRLLLTAAGLELSDAIAPWLHSDQVRRKLRDFGR